MPGEMSGEIGRMRAEPAVGDTLCEVSACFNCTHRLARRGSGVNCLTEPEPRR
jgi:hypothetical protein